MSKERNTTLDEDTLDNLGQSLAGDSWHPGGPECPPEDDWVGTAEGSVPDDIALACISHAAQCDVCGVLLKRAAEEATQRREVTQRDFLLARMRMQRLMAR